MAATMARFGSTKAANAAFIAWASTQPLAPLFERARATEAAAAAPNTDETEDDAGDDEQRRQQGGEQGNQWRSEQQGAPPFAETYSFDSDDVEDVTPATQEAAPPATGGGGGGGWDPSAAVGQQDHGRSKPTMFQEYMEHTPAANDNESGTPGAYWGGGEDHGDAQRRPGESLRHFADRTDEACEGWGEKLASAPTHAKTTPDPLRPVGPRWSCSPKGTHCRRCRR